MKCFLSVRMLSVVVALLAVHITVQSQQPTQEEQDLSTIEKKDTPRPSAKWSVHGRVVDGNGNPIGGVTVKANTGIGTLFVAGRGQTDSDGTYEFAFGPGIHFANNDVQMQFATVSASMPGYFAANLGEQGGLLMALRIPENYDFERRNAHREDVILPDEPRRLDFVLLPAAEIAGTLVDENSQPLAGYGISLKGRELPPSSSVAASGKTDSTGMFRVSGIPTGYQYQILVQPAERRWPWNAWASGPLQFAIEPGNSIALSAGDDSYRAKKFEIQVRTSGVNWKRALRIAAEHQRIETSGNALKLTLAPPGGNQTEPDFPETVQVSIGRLTSEGIPNDESDFENAYASSIPLSGGRASIEIPESIQFSFAKPRSVSTKLRGTFRVDIRFEFVGDQDTDRRVLIDVRAINDRRETAFHTWRVTAEKRSAPNKAGERPTRGLTSTRIEIPRRALEDIEVMQIGFRELTKREIAKIPARPLRTNMRVSKPNKQGEFVVSFENPLDKNEGRRLLLDPKIHQVVVQLFVRDQHGTLIRKTLQQVPARPVGGYKVRHKIDPLLFPFSTINTTFVTIQPEHEQWLDDFFRKGKGTSYKGIWTSDSGELNQVQLDGSED